MNLVNVVQQLRADGNQARNKDRATARNLKGWLSWECTYKWRETKGWITGNCQLNPHMDAKPGHHCQTKSIPYTGIVFFAHGANPAAGLCNEIMPLYF